MGCKAFRCRGFTLIEMLVVIVVVGVMLVIAMPSTRNAKAVQQQVSLDKFVATLEAAMFASVIGGQHLRLVTDGQRYHFEKRQNDGSWARPALASSLKAGELNSDVHIEQVWLDNQPKRPPLRIDFNGATPPLIRLQLREAHQIIQLESTASGGLRQIESLGTMSSDLADAGPRL